VGGGGDVSNCPVERKCGTKEEKISAKGSRKYGKNGFQYTTIPQRKASSYLGEKLGLQK
jgi:hypothetical protein